ncbi:MAG: formylglycine-generating enzyme family protein [Planctomycetes bacterium]|nr:formylglycine-generating enzyme family protein [Planctomycetota bacterium]
MPENPVDPTAEPPGATRGARGRRPMLQALFESLQPGAAVDQRKSIENSQGERFVLIPAGNFQMGSPADEIGHRANESPRREVHVTKAFFLGIHPVTQASFERVMGRNPSRFQSGKVGKLKNPVENVSWDEANEYCRRLGMVREEAALNHRYRLPTEAEWELACRAGTATPFCFGETLLPEQATFDTRLAIAEDAGTTPVDLHPANLFGLYDMHGNVWEWCADWYDAGYYRSGSVRDPAGPPTGRFRVLRGGSWRNQADKCRAAYRNGLEPFQRDSASGFRVVLVTQPAS